MMDDKYHPRQIGELMDDRTPVSLIKEPIGGDVAELRRIAALIRPGP
jgi:hypothetical protein